MVSAHVLAVLCEEEEEVVGGRDTNMVVEPVCKVCVTDLKDVGGVD